MDVTPVFKACIKTLKSRNKEFSESGSLLKPRKKNEFMNQSKDLVKQITSLRDFLLEHRKAYLNFGHSYVQSTLMTDHERDKIDHGAQSIIKTCSSLLNEMRAKIPKSSKQNSENMEAVINIIETYLKNVTKINIEQRAIRIKYTTEMQKLTKLEGKSRVLNKETSEKVASPVTEIRDSSKDRASELTEEKLTEEELQMFEFENDQLYNELNSLNEEVQEIQSKVVKIAELQELFTEKVLEQNEELEQVSSTLVGTTENIKDANSQIRQAIQSNAGLRIYVLFFILVMSLSLLFLDWYNE